MLWFNLLYVLEIAYTHHARWFVGSAFYKDLPSDKPQSRSFPNFGLIFYCLFILDSYKNINETFLLKGELFAISLFYR